jgi:hypothetical protein
MHHKIDDIAYASDVTLYGVKAKLLYKDVKACSVLRSIVGDGIAKGVSDIVVV